VGRKRKPAKKVVSGSEEPLLVREELIHPSENLSETESKSPTKNQSKDSTVDSKKKTKNQAQEPNIQTQNMYLSQIIQM